MPRRFSSQSLLAASLVGAWLLTGLCAQVEARPKYKKVFDSTYPDVVAKTKKLNCLVCHVGDDKKKRNHYGEALAKELKERNEQDEKTIKEALLAIEGGECRSGKWKERLDEGKPPCVCGSRDYDPSSYIARQLARERAKNP
jgi:hypothetical protein